MIKKLLSSFDNKQESGFSARKLTAFWCVMLLTFLHYKYVNFENCIDAIMVDSALVLILLGIITAEQIIKFKNGNNDNNEPTKEG